MPSTAARPLRALISNNQIIPVDSSVLSCQILYLLALEIPWMPERELLIKFEFLVLFLGGL